MPREIIRSLSPRESEILRLAAEGHPDAVIAEILGISEGTVGTYWGRIRTKLGPHPRTALIAARVRGELQGKLEQAVRESEDLAGRLHASEEDDSLFHEVVDAADEGVVLIDAQGLIVYANRAVHEAFGYPSGALRNRAFVCLLPEPVRASRMRRFAALCAAGSPAGAQPWARLRLDVRGVTRDGRTIGVTVLVSVVHRGEQTLIACFIRTPRAERASPDSDPTQETG